MSVTSWRILAAVAVCLVAASLGAAIEMYDELPPDDMNLIYQEHNFIEPGPQSSPPEPKLDDSVMRDFLLYKMLYSFRNRDASSSYNKAGPKWFPSGQVLMPSDTFPETFDQSLMKGTIMKRFPDRNGNVPMGRGHAKPNVQKWKIKKGKVGSQLICYFKLCSFRPSA